MTAVGSADHVGDKTAQFAVAEAHGAVFRGRWTGHLGGDQMSVGALGRRGGMILHNNT